MRALLHALGDHLHGIERPLVAVLDGAGTHDWAALIRHHHPRARVSVLDPAALRPGSLHARLAARGRHDAVVVAAECPLQGVRLLRATLLHLRREGRLFVHRPQRVGSASAPDPWEPVLQVLGAEEPPEVTEPDVARVLSAVSAHAQAEDHLVFVNGVEALAKLREHEMDEVLRLRGSRSGRVVTTLPGGRFESRCELHENKPTRDAGMPQYFDVPPHALREYRDVTCHSRQVAVHRNLVLPDSFRFNAGPRLVNTFLPAVGHAFAQPPARPRKRMLPGAYFYLDSEWGPHFGHALTEQMSRLWAVARARQDHPDLKAVLSRRHRGQGLAPYERAIFEAVGFAEDDIVLHHRPVRVERLLAATPMFSGGGAPDPGVLPRHVHPDLRDLWIEIGDRIVASASDAAYPRRLFCSRRRARRACVNVDEVEAWFTARGFAVVYPEDLPFPDQVAMFRGADVIAGFAGSALFTAAFCDEPKRMIVLGPTTYHARNEYMVCAVAGHRLDYVWSPPEAGAKVTAAPFRVDLAAQHFLADVVASL